MEKPIKHFRSSFFITFIGIIAAACVGYFGKSESPWNAALQAVFISLVLAVLEISLSFDNAVVNASLLKQMSAVWRKRFLTWGILIAVFGMRLIFPLLVICLATHIGPWAALHLALQEPDRYKEVMGGAHVAISAFGGSFLLMVALNFFFDPSQHQFWLSAIERPMSQLGKVKGLKLVIGVLALVAISSIQNGGSAQKFLVAGFFGLIVFAAVDLLSSLLNVPSGTQKNIEKASVGLFVYLEVLDASFSFDGVIGAFALTNNLFIMMIGLGIGALFVRSLTLLLVDHDTLGRYKYLEHGAFYAIFILAMAMYLSTFVEIPEAVTGLSGAIIIALAFASSFRSNLRHGRAAQL